MSGIFIRAFFGGWKPATREKALAFARFYYKNITAVPEKKVAEFINERFLRGVAFTLEEIKAVPRKNRPA